MEIAFKKAESEDIPNLVEFMEEYYECDHLLFNARVAQKALEDLVGDDSAGMVMWIQCDGKEVGYIVLSYICSLEFHGRSAFVDEFYIREGYRGKGVGAKTMEFVAEFCRNKRIDALRLEVENANTHARKFYADSGFKAHDRVLMTRWLDGKRSL